MFNDQFLARLLQAITSKDENRFIQLLRNPSPHTLDFNITRVINLYLADGTTLLYQAVKANWYSAARALIEFGADTDLINQPHCDPMDANKNPLMQACRANQADLVKLLVAYGANLPPNFRVPAWIAQQTPEIQRYIALSKPTSDSQLAAYAPDRTKAGGHCFGETIKWMKSYFKSIAPQKDKHYDKFFEFYANRLELVIQAPQTFDRQVKNFADKIIDLQKEQRIPLYLFCKEYYLSILDTNDAVNDKLPDLYKQNICAIGILLTISYNRGDGLGSRMHQVGIVHHAFGSYELFDINFPGRTLTATIYQLLKGIWHYYKTITLVTVEYCSNQDVLPIEIDPLTNHQIGEWKIFLSTIRLQDFIELVCSDYTYYFSNQIENISLHTILSLVPKTAQTVKILNTFYNGMTILHLAAKHNDAETIRLAMDAGADPNLINAKGRRPLDYANNPTIRQYLMSVSRPPVLAIPIPAPISGSSFAPNPVQAAKRNKKSKGKCIIV